MYAYGNTTSSQGEESPRHCNEDITSTNDVTNQEELGGAHAWECEKPQEDALESQNIPNITKVVKRHDIGFLGLIKT